MTRARHPVASLVLLLVFGMLVASSVFADPELETVVVTGRASPATAADIAGSVGVVSALELDLIRHTHINEAADRVSGVWLSRGNGQEHLTAIRSPVLTGPGSCGAFLVLQDGIPTRPAGFCNVNQLFEINSEQAERIEIFRGPVSAYYGSNALHGIINVITPEPGDRDDHAMLDAGPHDYARLFVTVGDEQFLVNAHTDHDGGYKDDSGFGQQKVNLRWHNRDSNSAAREGFIEVTNLNQETAGYVDGNNAYRDDSRKRENTNPEAFRDAQSSHGYLKFSGTLANGQQWQLTPYANTSQMAFLQHWITTAPLEKNNHVSAGLQGRLQLLADDTGLWPLLKTVVGFDLETGRAAVDEYQSAPTQFGFVQGQHYDFNVNMYTAGVFADMEYPLSSQWRLMAGLRYDRELYQYDNAEPANTVGNYTRLPDRDDSFGDASYRLGAVFRYRPQHQWYASMSTGYRTPQIAELYRLEGGVPSEAVQEEQIQNLEFGWRGVAPDASSDKWAYEVSVFAMDKDHVIFKKSNRQYLGNGETSHRGIELSFDYRFQGGTYLKTAWTYAEHRYEKINGQLQGSPAVDLENDIIDTAPRYFGGVQLGQVYTWGLAELEMKQMGPYYLDPEHDWQYDGHRLLNVRVQYWPSDDLRLTARLLNLADVDYAERADVNFSNEPRYFVGEPRSLYLSIEKDF